MLNQPQANQDALAVRQLWLSSLVVLACLLPSGCRNPSLPPNPYGGPPNNYNWQGAPPNMGAYMQQPQLPMADAAAFAQQQAAPQMMEFQRRMQQLDENNRQLTSQLAQAQQQAQALQERYQLVAKQLSDATAQNRQLLATAQQYANQALGMQASMTARGGAKLTANNSLANSPAGFNIAGATVVPDGNSIRIRMSADQMFAPGTAQLNPAAATMLDQVANTLMRQFPRQRVAIEAHSDNASSTFNAPGSFNAAGSVNQISSAQAQAVMDQLVRRNGVPAQQLFVVAQGPNQPIADNQTPAGRAENRRIEVVIYPQTF